MGTDLRTCCVNQLGEVAAHTADILHERMTVVRIQAKPPAICGMAEDQARVEDRSVRQPPGDQQVFDFVPSNPRARSDGVTLCHQCINSSDQLWRKACIRHGLSKLLRQMQKLEPIKTMPEETEKQFRLFANANTQN